MTRLGEFFATTIGKLVIAGVIGLVILIAFKSCSDARERAEQAEQDSRIANATADAAADAVEAVVARTGDEAGIDQVVNQAAKDIANAPGSDQAIPPAARAAALRAACRLRSYTDEPACQVLRVSADGMAGGR